MKSCNELDIREVVQLSGIPASTLRYYEEKGLIKSIGREGVTRVFASSVIDQLALICLGRHAGFSLDEIGGIFSANGRPTIDRTQLLQKADDLNNSIQQLTVLRESKSALTLKS